MNKNDVWSLFTKTGKVQYYLKYKSMIEKKADNLGNNGSKRNSN